MQQYFEKNSQIAQTGRITVESEGVKYPIGRGLVENKHLASSS